MVQQQHLRDATYAKIHAAIFDGTLRRGELLSENQLAQMCQVSRTPVREALRLLEKDGIVTVHPRVGAVIKQPTLREVDEVFESRIIIETGCIAKAMDRLDDAALAAIRDEMLSFSDYQGPLLNFMARMQSAHDVIMNNCGNSTLHGLWRELRYRTRLANLFYTDWEGHVAADRLQWHIGEHVGVIDAMRSRDPEAARQALSGHLQRTWDYTRKLAVDFLMEQGPGSLSLR